MSSTLSHHQRIGNALWEPARPAARNPRRNDTPVAPGAWERTSRPASADAIHAAPTAPARIANFVGPATDAGVRPAVPSRTRPANRTQRIPGAAPRGVSAAAAKRARAHNRRIALVALGSTGAFVSLFASMALQ
jgi:hypothetical protein